MRVLWITNSPFPEVYEELNMEALVNVGWVDSSAKGILEQNSEIILGVASFFNVNELKTITKERKVHFLLPSKLRNKPESEELKKTWLNIQMQFKPDIVHIHGTEYPHSYSYVKACGSNNTVVSIQGLVSIIERYYLGNISSNDLIKSTTLRDLFRFDTIFSQKRNMKHRGEHEKLLIQNVKHIIGRTSWDKSHIWAINPTANYHFCNETLRTSFYKRHWSLANCERYSIFISQAYYPIKGFHQLLKALPIVRKHYPEVKVYVAGNNFFSNRGIRINGFGNYINSLINKYNLSDHIIFSGILSEEAMCQRFLSSHLFVSPSAIENSPNSVGEAQLLGVPCIASYVGGTADMVDHGKTGLLYRFEEVEMLAANICKLFSDDQLATMISKNGKISAMQRHSKELNAKTLIQIYSKIMALDS